MATKRFETYEELRSIIAKEHTKRVIKRTSFIDEVTDELNIELEKFLKTVTLETDIVDNFSLVVYKVDKNLNIDGRLQLSRDFTDEEMDDETVDIEDLVLGYIDLSDLEFVSANNYDLKDSLILKTMLLYLEGNLKKEAKNVWNKTLLFFTSDKVIDSLLLDNNGEYGNNNTINHLNRYLNDEEFEYAIELIKEEKKIAEKAYEIDFQDRIHKYKSMSNEELKDVVLKDLYALSKIPKDELKYVNNIVRKIYE